MILMINYKIISIASLLHTNIHIYALPVSHNAIFSPLSQITVYRTMNGYQYLYGGRL